MKGLPIGELLINAFKPQTNAGIITGDYISLKTAHRVWVVFQVAQANAAQITCSLMKATAVAPTGAVAVTETVPIWSNEDCDTDLFSEETAAASFELDAALKTKLLIMEVDPSILGNYDCLAAKISASDVANIVGAFYIIENRYKDEVPPSVIID